MKKKDFEAYKLEYHMILLDFHVKLGRLKKCKQKDVEKLFPEENFGFFENLRSISEIHR